jgi:hypothetical protein
VAYIHNGVLFKKNKIMSFAIKIDGTGDHHVK